MLKFIVKFAGEYLTEQEYSIQANTKEQAENLANEALYDVALEQGAFEAFDELDYTEEYLDELKDNSVWVVSLEEWDESMHEDFDLYEVLIPC